MLKQSNHKIVTVTDKWVYQQGVPQTPHTDQLRLQIIQGAMLDLGIKEDEDNNRASSRLLKALMLGKQIDKWYLFFHAS